MKALLGLWSLLFVFHHGLSQNKDTTYLNLTNFKLHPGTFSWRGTNTFHKMTAWDTSPYTEGHLKQGNSFRMNYRLLHPLNYNEEYKPGYPLIVMMHGGGERGNCWDTNCYCTGCNANGTPDPNVDPRFLNNDHVLLHGGSQHLAARDLAGGKLPNDPTLDPKAFPGFVLFPQNQNDWGSATSSTSQVSYALRIVRLLCRQYNIDEDRIYIHGLSRGGQGVYKALNMADWLFAAAATMSAISFQNSLEYDSIANIPLWAFQGGRDDNPTPAQTQSLVRKFREAGGIARYTLYPTLGHGTWNTAYREPDFFSWLLSHNKSNIHVYYGIPFICGTTGQGVKLGVTQGFLAYQWERNGQIIPDAKSYLYIATVPGVYRARYSRVSTTPTEEQWNKWSDPVTVSERNPTQPVLDQTGSIVLRDLNSNGDATLQAPEGFDYYYWYKNDVLTSTTEANTLTINGCSAAPCANSGKYTVATAAFDKCPSPVSKPKYVLLGVHNVAPTIPKPTNFTGKPLAPARVLLQWDDVSGGERGYEIWRRKSTSPEIGEWYMAALTAEDVTLFIDTGVEPGTTYYYKIRGVSNTGKSDYAPGNDKSNPAHNLIITTPSESSPPSIPQNLTATATGIRAISLTWEASTDESGIKEYVINYNGTSVSTGSNDTSYTLSDLALNTVYTFNVQGVDFGNNISPSSNYATANTYTQGLFYYHSTGAWADLDEPTMVATWSAPEFTGHLPNFTLAPRTQEDFFNFRFFGYLYITTAGTYQFSTTSNEGSRLELNDVIIVDNNGLHSSVRVESDPINLSPGPQLIDVKYFEYTGSQSLTVQYKGPDTNDAWVTIPASALQSGTPPQPPAPPSPPSSLVAHAVGMTQINLEWQYSESIAEQTDFEIFRAASSAGPFVLVARSNTTTASDVNLLPGTTYYYKVRAATPHTPSSFSPVASATTVADNEAPSQPQELTVTSTTLSKVGLSWSSSTDNAAVSFYEIWANGILVGISEMPAFLAEDLAPDTQYSFTVIAVDESGNKSSASASVSTKTFFGEVFYSKSSGSLNDLTTWGRNPNGSGENPESFSTNGLQLMVSNRTTTTLGGPWSVEGPTSKVIVPGGVTLTFDHACNTRLEVRGNGIVNLNHAEAPDLVALSSTSTVNYNSASAIQAITYGNLGLSNGVKLFPSGTITVLGNITASSGVSLKGDANNESKIILSGNLTIGVPAELEDSFGVSLELTSNETQTITSGGNLSLFKIKKTGGGNVVLTNTGAPVTFMLGSSKGGGLSIQPGSILMVGNNNITIGGSGTINSEGESGTISVNSGSISITSSNSANSNLYVDSGNNMLSRLSTNLTGAGKLFVHNPLFISAGLKIHAGTLHANGNITLLATASQTANLEEIENNGKVTGDITVQHYLHPKGKVYHPISSAVEDLTVGDWQNSFPITGSFSGASTGPGLTSDPSLFYYQEPEGWKPYPTTNNSAPIEKGRGYSALMHNGSSPTLITTRGNPYQGNITYSIQAPSAQDNGWNLLGNPYASSIVWTNNSLAWIKNNVGTVISVTDNTPTRSKYHYYDAATGLGGATGEFLEGGILASGQAFWIQTIDTNPSLTVTEKSKSNASQTIPEVSHIKITLRNESETDVTYIAFTDFGMDTFDKEFDGLKRANENMFNLSSLSDNAVSLAINNMSDAFCEKSIKLNIQNVNAGTYTLSFDKLQTLLGFREIVLTDNFTNTVVNLYSSNQYSFVVSSDPQSFGAERFALRLAREDLNLSVKSSAQDVCGEDVSINLTDTQAGASYTALGSDGQQISETEISAGNAVALTIPKEKLTEGLNQVRIKAAYKGCMEQELPGLVTFHYTTPPVAQVNDVSVCEGDPATVEVSGAPANGSYKWFNENLEEISGFTGATLQTDPIIEERRYAVTAIHPNGCAGPKQWIAVYPEVVDMPIITSQEDTLFSSVHGELQWYRNGEPLPNEVSQFMVPKTSGIYTVGITQGGCQKFSEPFEINITGTEPQSATAFRYWIYPNPASSHDVNLKVESASHSPLQIKIIDVVGKGLYNEWINPSDLAAGVKITPVFQPGIYFMIIQQDDATEKARFIIRQ